MRRFPASLVLLALLAPVPALAGGMPQLAFNNPLTLDQVWWGAGIFAVFLLLVWKWGLPRVASVLEDRSAHIAADLDAARAAKATADAAAAEVTAAIAAARSESQAAISAAVEAAKADEATRGAVLNARLEAQLAQAEQQIGAARVAALGALRQVAGETAATVVARLTGAPAASGRIDQEVAAALAARGITESPA